MQKTTLGLTRLAPGEGLSADNFSFQDINPKITDGLLQYAAFRHRHDAHVALASPAVPPVAATDVAGGTIASDTTVYVGYTLTDADGGETLLNPDPVVITTQGGLDTPTDGPDLTVAHDEGTLVAGTYGYAITVTDAFGGETALGPPTSIVIPTGSATNRVEVSGLAALMADSAGSGYRLWRRVNGGGWGLVSSGATDTVNDDGTLCVDCGNVTPPIRTGRTNATNTLRVTVPAGTNAAATSFSIYASLDGTFANPCLLGTYPVADLATEKVYTELTFIDGAPPEASLTMAGAPKINYDTDIINLRLREPVATAADLPTVGNRDGDLRVSLEDHNLYLWDDATGAWGNVSTGEAATSLPHVIADEGVALTQRGTLNFVGDGVTVADEGGQTVVHIDTSGASGGHEIQDEGVELPQRAALNFVGAGVAATDESGVTVVRIPGASGGSGTGGTLNWAGAWDVATDYAIGDVVRAVDIDGTERLWVAFDDPAIGDDPAAASGAWQLMVASSAGGGASASRQTINVVGTGNRDVALPRGYRLLKLVATEGPTRVRLYTRADRRAADVARTIDVAPAGSDHGVIFDAELDADAPLTITPALDGWNDDNAVADQGYARIDAATAGVVTLTYVQTEA